MALRNLIRLRRLPLTGALTAKLANAFYVSVGKFCRRVAFATKCCSMQLAVPLVFRSGRPADVLGVDAPVMAAAA